MTKADKKTEPSDYAYNQGQGTRNAGFSSSYHGFSASSFQNGGHPSQSQSSAPSKPMHNQPSGPKITTSPFSTGYEKAAANNLNNLNNLNRQSGAKSSHSNSNSKPSNLFKRIGEDTVQQGKDIYKVKTSVLPDGSVRREFIKINKQPNQPSAEFSKKPQTAEPRETKEPRPRNQHLPTGMKIPTPIQPLNHPKYAKPAKVVNHPKYANPAKYGDFKEYGDNGDYKDYNKSKESKELGKFEKSGKSIEHFQNLKNPQIRLEAQKKALNMPDASILAPILERARQQFVQHRLDKGQTNIIQIQHTHRQGERFTNTTNTHQTADKHTLNTLASSTNSSQPLACFRL